MSGARLLKGALAGCLATGPMTGAMLLMHRFLPGEQQYALPPMLITRRLTGGKGPFARLGTHEHKGLTFLTHFGFGTAFGAAYALLPRQGPLPAPLRGVLFALCVWTGSYLGWIPAANLLPPATRHPAGRNALMIVAHLIWGGLLGLLLERLDPDEASPWGDDFAPAQEGRHDVTARPRPGSAEVATVSASAVLPTPPAAALPAESLPPVDADDGVNGDGGAPCGWGTRSGGYCRRRASFLASDSMGGQGVALAAVIFDVDGTLVDTNAVHVEAWQRAFARYGYAISSEQLAAEVGKGGDNLVPALIGAEGDNEHGDELREAHGEEFLHLAAIRPLRAFPGVRPLFEAIHERGLRLALATSARMTYLDVTLARADLNLKSLVEELVTADDAAASKPAPDIVVAAVQKLGLQAAQCVMVGDTPHDGEACRRAGVPFAGLLCGGRPADALREAGAVAVWADPVDLLEHLDETLTLAGQTAPA